MPVVALPSSLLGRKGWAARYIEEPGLAASFPFVVRNQVAQGMVGEPLDDLGYTCCRCSGLARADSVAHTGLSAYWRTQHFVLVLEPELEQLVVLSVCSKLPLVAALEHRVQETGWSLIVTSWVVQTAQ